MTNYKICLQLWKGGITKLHLKIRELFIYKEWRNNIFKRDNFKCIECMDSRGGNLHAHHIKTFSNILNEFKIKNINDAIKCNLLWDENNGITLCNKCHSKKHPNIKFI